MIIHNSGTPNAIESLYAVIESHDKGWLVLDYLRGYVKSELVPLHDLVYEDRQVEYLGWFGNVYILRWGGE